MRTTAILTLLTLTFACANASFAADYFVAPDGKTGNAGTADSPWDIESAWAGQQNIQPGDTLYMKGGVYRHPQREWDGGSYTINLAGAEDAPIHIRPVPGERVTIDAGVVVSTRSRDLWLWDLEITIAEAGEWNRHIEESGSHPRPAIDQPQGGLNILGGANSRFINLVVHTTNSTGIGFWKGAVDAELHGCIIYDNGWIGPDRYHGPGIYTQNQNGHKWITDNILFANYSTTIQAYGSRNAYVDGFRVVGNISFAPLREGSRAKFLIGGGRPSQDIVVSENILYEVPLQIGYNAPHNEDAIIHDNVIVKAGMSINRYRETDERNNTVFNPGQDRPTEGSDAKLRPNKYDPNRANLAIFNWARADSVNVDMDEFLQRGDTYRVMNVLDYFGKPVAQGTYNGQPVAIPVPAIDETGGGEFCAYVVFRAGN